MNKEIKNMFDNLTPTEKDKQKIWKKIEEKIDAGKIEEKANSQNIWKRVGKTASATAAIVAIFFMLGLCANAATNGKVTKALQQMWDKEEEQKKEKEVLEETLKITQKMTVYAPEIYACTERYLVFAHLRGMVIYDRKEASVASVVDLQEIDCNNFDTQTRFTHILLEGEKLIIFNEENGKADAIYYECSLAGDTKEIALTKMERNGKDLYGSWKKYEKSHYVDTFDSLPSYIDKIDGISAYQYLNTNVMYSENSFGWEMENGSKKQSTLLVEYDKKTNPNESATYALLTLDKEGKEYQKETLKIELTLEEAEEEYLPRFLYTGEDKRMAAICEMMYKKFDDSEDSGENVPSVFIPHPVILGTEEENGEEIVFIQLNYDFFIKNGNVLEEYGGASLSARLIMTRTEEGFKVKKCELAGDGAKNMEDINRFTKNYPEMKEAYYNYEEPAVILQEMLQMYRQETGLDIEYYKYYGSDKVKISEKR